MAEVIKKETGREVSIKEGRNNSFEVTVGGKNIFSKLKEDRFPKADEIMKALK